MKAPSNSDGPKTKKANAYSAFYIGLSNSKSKKVKDKRAKGYGDRSRDMLLEEDTIDIFDGIKEGSSFMEKW